MSEKLHFDTPEEMFDYVNSIQGVINEMNEKIKKIKERFTNDRKKSKSQIEEWFYGEYEQPGSEEKPGTDEPGTEE